MGIAKSAPTEEAKPAVKKEFTSSAHSNIPTIGWDIMRFFNVDFDAVGRGSTEEQLKDIEHWTYKDVETAGDGLSKLKQLEIKLGVPQNGESRITRLHRYVKMQRQIDDLMARQRSL